VSGGTAEVGSTANNYQILARLATGGMAEIFLARGVSGTGVARYVVLKRILRDRADDVQLVKMFLDEARLAAQLNHPNVAQVYDIGKLGESYFFTMEYVHGETVRGLLHRARSLRRELPTNVILTVVAGAASGLHHAHERLGHDGRPLGIVHRDVSPSNLMVSYEGAVKVVDFGVAKAENRAQETRSGTVKGKIAYLSPEQCRGAPVDRRSDLFSLGIVFWEMLTVERLYKRNSDFENMTAIVTEDPVPPSRRRPGIAPELDRIVMRLLSKDPAARYQNADELVDALEEAAPKIGGMISSSSVGRLLREMFGQRPEPWLEMDTTVELPQQEGVTVTSEPIPKELGAAPQSSMDMLLQHVPMLASRVSTEGMPGVPVAVPIAAQSQMLTTPAMVAQDPRLTAATVAEGPAKNNLLYTIHGHQPPQSQRASGALPQLPQGAPMAPIAQESFPPAGSSSGEHAYPASGPQAFRGGAGSSSGVHGYQPGSESGYPVLPTPNKKSQRSWSLIAIVAGAAIIGSLTVFLVMRGSGGKTVPDAPVIGLAPADAVEEPAIDNAVAEIDAETRAADAEVKAVDAAKTVVDAAPVAVDAAPAPADAAPVAVDAAPKQQDPIDVAMKANKFSDALAACSRGFNAEHAAACTLAACHINQDAKAQKWFARIANAASRKVVTNSCRIDGLEVPKIRPPPPPSRDAGVVDQCAANPMSCQH
jgi:serine/threonine protein kinase